MSYLCSECFDEIDEDQAESSGLCADCYFESFSESDDLDIHHCTECGADVPLSAFDDDQCCPECGA